MRSFEDINSSGYSSGDVIARQGLSKGIPVTRQRIKAKRNEVNKFLLLNWILKINNPIEGPNSD